MHIMLAIATTQDKVGDSGTGSGSDVEHTVATTVIINESLNEN